MYIDINFSVFLRNAFKGTIWINRRIYWYINKLFSDLLNIVPYSNYQNIVLYIIIKNTETQIL